MQKIILTAINAKYSHSNPALYYLKKAIDNFNTAECYIQDWDINRPVRELLEKLSISGGTQFLFSAYIWNSQFLKQLIPALAMLYPEAVIGAGGPEAVFKSDDWLKIPGLDYVFEGNAEDFAELLPKIEKPERPLLLKRPPSPFCNTPFPYTREGLKNLEGRIVYYEASRGCRFNCSYCLSSTGSGPDYRTASQITEEIKLLGLFKGTVKFVDRTFNAEPDLSRLIWRLMAENPPAGCFHFELHPLLLNEEDFELINKLPPGSAQFEIGIQSTDPAILGLVNRPDNWVQSKKAIKRISASGSFHIHLDQITGLPGDTPETAAESMNEILSLQPDKFQLGFLKLLPGTPLAEQAEEFGILAESTPPYEILQTGNFSFQQLQYFHKIEQLIKTLYNSEFFKASLPFLSQACGGWFRLFDSMLKFLIRTGKMKDAPDLNNQRWEFWGRQLLFLTEEEFPLLRKQLIDLLRLDWCPFAGAQYYPDFIKYDDNKKMNNLKTEACRKLQLVRPDLEKSGLKRAILYIPEHRSSSEQESENILFLKHNGKIEQFRV